MSEQRLPKKRSTLIKFAIPHDVYVQGKGNTTSLEIVTMPVATNPDGSSKETDCFYCEWINAYGNIAIQQQSNGAERTARIRMAFNKIVYNALHDKRVKIYLHGVIDAEHCYELASIPDNYAECNKMLEFNVQHYEGK